MRKLKLQVQMSIDGFIAGPNGEMHWMIWNWDEALLKYVSDITAPVDCIILGRKLAQGFIPHWTAELNNPNGVEEGAKKMVETPKIVFSKTLTDTDWENTVVARGDLVEEITALKKQAGNDIIAYGGAGFVSSLIKHGLIDEYHLFINPTAIGKGMTIFNGLDKDLKLNLVKSTSFDCGIVVLHYEPNPL